jgi:hypothetical protein
MSQIKQASKQKRTTKVAAVKVLGAAGLSFSLVGNASASTMPTVGIPQSDNTSPNQRFVLSDEEMSDVSLATFYVFDRENVGSRVQEARGCGGCGRGGDCGGCRGCGGLGFGGCRGCGGCGCGGVWIGGCAGCVGCAVGVVSGWASEVAAVAQDAMEALIAKKVAQLEGAIHLAASLGSLAPFG